MLKKFGLGLLGLVLLLALVLVLNTYRQRSRQMAVASADVQAMAALAVDKAGAAQSLAEAVRARTVSGLADPAGTAAEFDKLHAHLRARYPLVHEKLALEKVGATLLYSWKGSDAAARPILWLAHQDVVPIAPGTETLWKQPPFDGKVEGGFVWGRGAWDNKGNLIAQLEAIEMALKAGFVPKRTLYLLFGHDEEVGGRQGAAKVAALFRERGIKPEWVLDEGLLVTQGILKGIEAPVALIGVAEKGSMSLRLSVDATPGHSSMPPGPGQSAIGVLSTALAKLDASMLPGGLGGLAGDMFATIAPEFGGAQRVVLSNLWLTRPLVEGMLAKAPSTNAMLRTTTAMTIVNAGNKANVLPGRADAVVNFRILPGDTPETVEAHVRRVVADERVQVARLDEPFLASPVSSHTAAGFNLIERTLRELIPNAVVAPGLMVAGTDARQFDGIADHVYRFTPIRADSERLKLFHGTDERIAVDDLADMIRFYRRLLTLAMGG